MTQEEYEAEVSAEREKRVQLLRATRGLLATALTKYQRKLEKKNPRLSEIIGGVRMVTDELRLEFRALQASDPGDEQPAGSAVDPLATIRLYRPAG